MGDTIEDVIERLKGAFAIALKQAAQMHRQGHDRQAIAHVLAVAREILNATQIHVAERSLGGEIDVSLVVTTMHERLDAAVSFVTSPAAPQP